MAVTQAQLTEIYLAYFGRPPDFDGLVYYTSNPDFTIWTVAAGFSASPESVALYGSTFNAAQINAIYQNLFNRDAEPAGLLYWSQEVASGRLTAAGAALGILLGAQNDDLVAVNNKLAVSAAFVAALDTSAEITGYTGTDAAASARDFLHTVDWTADSVTAAMAGLNDAVAAAVGLGGPAGQTFLLTSGQDNVAGTAGNDTILGIHDDSGADLVRTYTLGDNLDGGAGVDTLEINVYSDELDIGMATVTDVEALVVKNSYDDFDWLNVANKDFESVTVDYQGTNHYDYLYIDNMDGTTDLTIENVSMSDGYYFYRNYDELYDATEGSVAVTNTLQGWTENGSYSQYEGYNYFSNATEINHTLNVMDMAAGDEGVWIYDYIEASVDGAVVNTTINVDNVKTDDSEYNEVYVEVQQDTGETSDVNAVVNVTNSNSVYFYVDAYASGDDDGNDVIVWNADGLTDTYEYSAFESSGFEDITVNVAAGGAEVYYLDDNDTVDGDQTVTINATGDLTVTTTNFNGTVDNLTVTVTGAGDVNLGTAYLGDAGALDVVTVDASAMTGGFTINDNNGNAATIASGSGADSIKVNDYTTAVTTGAGNDKVNINGYDYGNALAKTIDGGDGTDTIVINDGALLSTALAANISGFEVLDITGATGGDTYDMSKEASLAAVVGTGSMNAVTLSNAAAGTTVSLTSSSSANSTVDALTYALKTATGTTDSFNLSLTAKDTDKLANDVDGQLTVTALTANAIETISISSNATTTDGTATKALTATAYVNTIGSLAADAVKTLTLTGDADLAINAVTATTLSKVDASAMGGSLIITLGATATASVAVLGGSAADTIVMTGNLAANNIIVGNAGADVITLAVAGTKETVRFAGDSDSALTLTDLSDPVVSPVVYDKASGYDSITNFTTAEDKIELSSLLGLATGDARSAITGKGTIGGGLIATNADLAAALGTLIGTGTDFFNDGAADRALAQVLVDGTTDAAMLFIDTNADGDFTNGVDQAIYLVGLTTGVVISDVVFG